MSADNSAPKAQAADSRAILRGRIPALTQRGPGQHATKLARSVYSGAVAAVLREAIIEGRLPAETPLVEMRLAEELHVSRGPVRSALHALEGEGLVRATPTGRTVVVGFDDHDLGDLFRARFHLESTAMRWGIQARADVAPMRAALAAIEAEGDSTSRLVDFDIAFHRTLVEFSGSRFLVQAWLALAPSIQTVITIGNRRLAGRDPRFHYERIVASHRPLVEAAAAYDADGAAQLLADQFSITKSMFIADTEDA